jgi:uncharacterized protein YndB with AHSA1/START domain
MANRDLDRVERSVVLPAPLEEVWAALTEPARISEWLGAEIEIDLRVGGRGVARDADGRVRRILVETLDPPRRLRFRWWPYQEDDAGYPGPSTQVEFTLREEPPGTRLGIVERAPAPGRAAPDVELASK